MLRERNTELVGLSIGSVCSHTAWMRNIADKLKVQVPCRSAVPVHC